MVPVGFLYICIFFSLHRCKREQSSPSMAPSHPHATASYRLHLRSSAVPFLVQINQLPLVVAVRRPTASCGVGWLPGSRGQCRYGAPAETPERRLLPCGLLVCAGQGNQPLAVAATLPCRARRVCRGHEQQVQPRPRIHPQPARPRSSPSSSTRRGKGTTAHYCGSP